MFMFIIVPRNKFSIINSISQYVCSLRPSGIFDLVMGKYDPDCDFPGAPPLSSLLSPPYIPSVPAEVQLKLINTETGVGINTMSS